MSHDAREMGFLEHLDELRTRVIRSCIAIGAGMVVAYCFVDRISSFLLAPTVRALPKGERLLIIRPGEGFAFDLNIALIGGCVLAAPFVMYQVWRFIAPGLYAQEKRFAIPFVALTTAGSIAGFLFNHYTLFPAMIAFFKAFDSPQLKFMPGIDGTFELYTRMLIGMVVAFQMPALVFSLTKMRLVTARFLWRHIKYAVLVIFIIAAWLTPSPDPWNQTVFAAPMILLYLVSIGIAWLVEPRGAAQENNRPRANSLGWGVLAAVAVHHARRQKRLASC